MKETNKRSGISLIVLVITIIVIIILAVAVILTLANNNPIENAKKAVSANDEATLKEEATLLYADWYLKENTEGDTGMTAQEYVEEYLSDGYDKDLIDRLTVSDSGVITISEPLNKVEGVVIPKGFEHVSGTTVATGLVIKNTSDDNEFVWVPVEEGTFERKEFPNGSVLSTDFIEPYTKDDYISEKTEYEAMVASVNTYGGFYIARYEASNNGSDKAQSIANKTPWNSIPWGTSMTDVTGGAVEAARSVYKDSSTKTTGDVVSTLTYGVQWDATLSFILKNYTFEDVSTNTEYGNYLNTETYEENLVDTGSVSTYALNNIYDFVGNVQEWTMEAYYYVYPDSTVDEGRNVRGGYYSAPIDSINNYMRLNQSLDTNNNYTGFRIALYIK